MFSWFSRAGFRCTAAFLKLSRRDEVRLRPPPGGWQATPSALGRPGGLVKRAALVVGGSKRKTPRGEAEVIPWVFVFPLWQPWVL